MSTMTKARKAERTEAITKLTEWVKPGATLYTVLRRVSRSGMSRSIDVLAVENGQIVNLSYWTARALDWRIDQKNGGIKVSGCGMDMGFHLINSLSYCVHGRDGADGKRGGYTFEHRWI